MRSAGEQISRAYWRLIEHELFNYDLTVRDLNDMRSAIINSSPQYLEPVSGGYISRPTESKAVSLQTNVSIVRMERTISAIDRALMRLNDEHRAIFELRYRSGYDWPRVCMEMPVSRRTYFRLRRELITMVATQLGYCS